MTTVKTLWICLYIHWYKNDPDNVAAEKLPVDKLQPKHNTAASCECCSYEAYQQKGFNEEDKWASGHSAAMSS